VAEAEVHADAEIEGIEPGGVSGSMKESFSRAFSYPSVIKTALGVARDVDLSDFRVKCIDLLGNRVDAELGIAFLVACYSILRRASTMAGLLSLGDLSIQGNIKTDRPVVGGTLASS
jgi:ATP-dependent Lon protease